MAKSSKPRLLTILLFVGVLSLFLYLANLVVYEALADIFTITISWQLIVLGTILGILSGSFLVATLLGMRYYNSFTRAYYLLSAIWIGFFVYLFLVSVVYGLFVILLGTPQSYIGEILVWGALLASVYGMLHARKIHITEIKISLSNLPAKWRDRKAIWISDLHLGQVYGPSFTRRIVEKINKLSHDIVFIGGDLYDGTGASDISELTLPLKKLSAPLGVYFVTGNHEEFGASDKFTSAIKSAGIRVLQDEVIEIDGLQIVGVDYRNASDRNRFKKILSLLSIDKNKPSILLKHEPKDLDIAQEAGISLQISGHTHHAQIWPLGYIAQLVYRGFSYGLKKFKNMQVYTSSGTGTWGPPMRVGTDCEIVVFTFFNSTP